MLSPFSLPSFPAPKLKIGSRMTPRTDSCTTHRTAATMRRLSRPRESLTESAMLTRTRSTAVPIETHESSTSSAGDACPSPPGPVEFPSSGCS